MMFKSDGKDSNDTSKNVDGSASGQNTTSANTKKNKKKNNKKKNKGESGATEIEAVVDDVVILREKEVEDSSRNNQIKEELAAAFSAAKSGIKLPEELIKSKDDQASGENQKKASKIRNRKNKKKKKTKQGEQDAEAGENE